MDTNGGVEGRETIEGNVMRTTTDTQEDDNEGGGYSG